MFKNEFFQSGSGAAFHAEEERLEASFAAFLALHSDGASSDFEAWLATQPPTDHVVLRRHYEDLRLVGVGGAAITRIGTLQGGVGKDAASTPFVGDRSTPMEDTEPPRAGKRFGNFRLVRRIGRGGMGDVWEAWQLPLKRRVALKLLRPELVAWVRARARFVLEAEAGARLSHEGIVGVHDYGEVGHVPYIAQELIEGGLSLARWIDARQRLEHRAPEEFQDVARLFVQVARALAAAHDAGVIHRDVTPSNLLIDPRGRVRVADFGLARVLDVPSVSVSGDFSGTLDYLSPQQAMARRIGIDARTDVYSLGVVLYETLTFVRPFRGDTFQQVLEKILYEEPVDPRRVRSRIPRDLAVIVTKAMDKERRHRFATMHAFADDLQRFLDGEPIEARPRGPERRALLSVRRNRSTWAAALALCVLSVGGTVIDRQRTERARAEQLADFERLGQWRERYERCVFVDPAAGPEQLALAEEARDLYARRVVHERRLQSLRGRALPRTDNDAELDIESHAESERLRFERARAEAEARARLAKETAASSGTGAATMGDTISSFADPVHAGERVAPVSHELLLLEERVHAQRSWRFESPQLAFEHAATEAFLKGLDGLFAVGGPVERVGANAGVLVDVEQRSVVAEDARVAWQRALRDLANEALYPHYGGLRMQPQFGLLPLGVDPRTKLWEFLVVASGVQPRRSADGEGFDLQGSDGIVLVLIPGGRFVMGRDDAVGARGGPLDDLADADEGPAHEVVLAPFFIGKYELTQGQYAYWMLTEAARAKSAYRGPLGGEPDLVHPLEQISWYEALQFARGLGLSLPTEAQWELAALGGARTRWWSGETRHSLVGPNGARANLADRAAAAEGARWPALLAWPDYDDGAAVHMRVDSLEPNGFGLHHVAGNVAEWCLDRYASYAEHPYLAPDTGERLSPTPGRRVVRGGSFRSSPQEVRATARGAEVATCVDATIGLRVVRGVL